jgi:ribosomal protein S19E (S16A)
VYDQRLIKKINQGRAFALVGSGPSSEVGYSSWKSLAERLTEELKRSGKLTDPPSYAKYLTQGKYPELFSQAERDLGSRDELVKLLSLLLKPAARKKGHIYNILTDWPFACYLTTNWDDEISEHLRSKKTYFTTLRNSKEELAQIRNGASRIIVKLHSDLARPDRAVITAGDYANLLGPEYEYFRERVRAIFEMFDVLIVGHSLSDPDLNLLLQIAKQSAHPEHPVFLVAADLTPAEIRDYLERFNIVAMTYSNADGAHLQLRRLLSLLDKFVIPRHKRLDLKTAEYSPEELEAAQAVAVYRRLVAGAREDLSPALYLGPLVLRSLQVQSEAQPLEKLLKISPLSVAATTENVKNLVPPALETLKAEGFVEQTDRGYKLTQKGSDRVKEISEAHTMEEGQAYGQFIVELQARHSNLKPNQQSDLVRLLQDTLVMVFKQRGLSIANAIFAGQSLGHNALGDVFSAISSAAAGISPSDLAVAFMEASQEFLLNPTEPQRRYLASISQGFFLYHLFGLDPSCTKIRREVFESTIWWCDSSTIIPLLAQGCANHEYATDLFTRLQKLKAHTLTTGRLVREVLEHLRWAIRFLEKEPLQSPAVLEAATQKGGYKQNLFLDGYIRLSAEERVSKFREYVEKVVPNGATDSGIRTALNKLGIEVINADELAGFKYEDTRQIFELVFEIITERERSATLRSNLQVEAEAEILHIIRMLKEGKYKAQFGGMHLERAYFLSQSRILDRIPPAEPISWTPEVLYRYVLSLPGEQLDPDLLQRCMLQEYFGTGVVVIDTARYEKFFGPSIDLANTTYKEEREKYLKDLSSVTPRELDQAFEQTPDLEKPFFVQQLGWRLAQEARLKADFATRQAEVALREVEDLKLQRDSKWKQRKEIQEKQFAAEKRNALDTKHLRKRLRQAKKRKQKKR